MTSARLLAYRVVTAHREGGQLVVECPYCGAVHHHGAGPDPERPIAGHRVAHCGRGDGYVLVIGGGHA